MTRKPYVVRHRTKPRYRQQMPVLLGRPVQVVTPTRSWWVGLTREELDAEVTRRRSARVVMPDRPPR